MNPLSDRELLFFTKLMLRYETEIKSNPKGYDIKSKELTRFLRAKGITLDYKKRPELYRGEKNTVVFSSHGSRCVDFIRHVRNAFAHGLVVKQGNTYELSDIYRKQLTMKGSIGMNLLKELITKIEATRKQ